MRVTWAQTGQLHIEEVTTPRTAVRRGATAEPVVPEQFLQSPHVSVEKTLEVTIDPAAVASATRRGEAAVPVLALQVETTGDEAALVVLRHPSGAITFHPSVTSTATRRGAKAGSVQHFNIPIRQAQTAEVRRNMITKAVKAVVLKVAKPVIDKVVDFALPKLARLWEEHAWTKHQLVKGWLRVVPQGNGRPLQLVPGVPDFTDRTLLFIHGTFSNAASAFGSLAQTDFFDKIRPLYGDRMFAFNHFTISESPQTNVENLLSALPDHKQTFDVITHSRGGLVLRTLVERAADLGPQASRFQLGRAVLVASPNEGTPLATPDRWEKTVGWFGNLMEIVNQFAPNPFTTGAEFVSEAIVWLAHHILGDLPGLSSMDAAGKTITDLQGPPAPPAHAYSALVANFNPDQSLLSRMVDAGVDQFFMGANDLVVPTEGGWRVDRQPVDAAQIGCFGPGGNLRPGETSPVMHTSFFVRQETATFIERALAGQPQNIPVVNANAPLPDHRIVRGMAVGASVLPPSAPPTAPMPSPEAAPAETGFVAPSTAAPDTFHLAVLEIPKQVRDEILAGESEPKDAAKLAQENTAKLTRTDKKQKKEKKVALLFASYGGARAVEPFGLRGGAAGKRFHDIIGIHERIKNFTDKQTGSMPSDIEMVRFGTLLFETLFPGDVKRLYDTARSLQSRDRNLDLVFTSMIDWVAEKPWEFAYDPGRKSYLATEEIHFVRNVLTLVPGDALEPKAGPLKILVVSAQPVGLAQLSIDEETQVIKRSFQKLIDADMAVVDVLPRATIPALHGCLSTGKYNVVHFIGHGTYDENKKKSFLLLEDGGGGLAKLDERSAREVFCRRGLDLIFLNACQTSAASPSEFNKGMAQALVAHGVPALVANQYSVLDVSATSFAQFFYWGLAHGMSFGAAAREARISVNYTIQGDPIDWAVPALYARDPNSPLVIPSGAHGVLSVKDGIVAVPEAPEAAASAVIRGARLRDSESGTLKVVVWDMDSALPKLENTLATLNERQARFEFKCRDLSAPLDSFEVKDGRRALRASRLARRLRNTPSELKADYLICITGHPIVDEKGALVYEWYSTTFDIPVLMLSYAGIRDLKPSSVETERALSNGIVALLAAARAKLARHDIPPSTCPLYLGRKPDLAIFTAEQRFDAKCRKQLKQVIGKDLPALEALLRTFDSVKPSGKQTTKRKKAGIAVAVS